MTRKSKQNKLKNAFPKEKNKINKKEILHNFATYFTNTIGLVFGNI